MTQYSFLCSLLFNLSWVGTLLWVQTQRKAYRHYMYLVEVATFSMLCFEAYREMIILTWHVQTQVNAMRTLLYGVEHVLLGVVLREALLYVEKYQKSRKRSRRIY